MSNNKTSKNPYHPYDASVSHYMDLAVHETFKMWISLIKLSVVVNEIPLAKDNELIVQMISDHITASKNIYSKLKENYQTNDHGVSSNEAEVFCQFIEDVFLIIIRYNLFIETDLLKIFTPNQEDLRGQIVSMFTLRNEIESKFTIEQAELVREIQNMYIRRNIIR